MTTGTMAFDALKNNPTMQKITNKSFDVFIVSPSEISSHFYMRQNVKHSDKKSAKQINICFALAVKAVFKSFCFTERKH